MSYLLEEVLKHATIANHDNELSSMVVLMVTKEGVPEMHLAVTTNDIPLMNISADLLKMELLRLINGAVNISGARE